MEIDSLLVEEDDKMLAAFCYLLWLLLSPVVLLSKKKNIPFVKFHALQAALFGILSSIGYGIVGLLVWGFFQAGAEKTDLAFGAFLMVIFGLYMLLFFIFFCFFLYFAWRAMQGHVFQILGIGPLVYRLSAPPDDAPP